MSDPFPVLKAKAFAAFDLGNHDYCQTLIVEALAYQPNDFSLLALMCRVRLIKSQYSIGRDIARHMISIAPDDSEGYLMLAWSIIDDHDHLPGSMAASDGAQQWKDGHEARIGSCRQLLQTCLELDPTDPRHYMLKAKLAYLEQNSQQAVDAAEEGLKFAPTNQPLHHYRILALEQLEDSLALKQALDEQLARSPEDAFTHGKLSEVFLSRKETDTAIRHAREAIRIQPDNESYKDTYWDAVMASNRWIRPIVNLRYSVKWFHRIPNWVQTCVIMFIGLLLGLALIVGDRFGEAVSGTVICISILMLLLFSVAVASERPFMAIFDLIYYFREPRYRISASNEKRNESLLFVGTFLAAVIAMASAAFKAFLPIGLMLLAVPIACVYYAKPWKLRLITVSLALLAGYLLWFGITTFPGSQAGSMDRIYAMYSVMGFMTICIASGVITKVWLSRTL